MQALPALQAFYQHISETVEILAGDPAQQVIVGEAKQALQYAEEMINNTSKKVQKMQRDAAQEGAPEGGQQPDPNAEADAQAKMAEHQMKMQMAQQKAQLDLQLKQAKFEQEQAMLDAKNAMELRQLQQ